MSANQLVKGLSFWETQSYFNNIDLIVIGSGIVGLNAAINFKKKNKKVKILILERGILPSGASTKNAGFACFGSPTELLADIKKTSSEVVWQTVEMRIKGLELLRNTVGEKQMDYQQHGGYELFNNIHLYNEAVSALAEFNKNSYAITKVKDVYSVAEKQTKKFNFKGIIGIIYNKSEGQINTGLMMHNLIRYAHKMGILILNSVAVSSLQDFETGVILQTNLGEFSCAHVIVATNGFANELLNITDVIPARAQVLVTKPIKNLRLKGTFHYDEGFYYFRNIGNRILLGGGRNLDFKTEQTTVIALNNKIQTKLNEMLAEIILPGIAHEVEQRWSGIMAVGSEKKPIIKKISSNVVCAVRMGGMGIAIGSLVGKLAVEELEN